MSCAQMKGHSYGFTMWPLKDTILTLFNPVVALLCPNQTSANANAQFGHCQQATTLFLNHHHHPCCMHNALHCPSPPSPIAATKHYHCQWPATTTACHTMTRMTCQHHISKWTSAHEVDVMWQWQCVVTIFSCLSPGESATSLFLSFLVSEYWLNSSISISQQIIRKLVMMDELYIVQKLKTNVLMPSQK